MAPKRKRMKLDNSTDEKDDSTEEVDDVKPNRKSRSNTQPDTPNVAQPKPKLDFMSLNDDCLRSILEKLSAKDLCSISQTCMRLQSLAARVFTHCHKEKRVIIKSITENGESIEYLFNDGAHIKCFGKFIQNVTFGKSFQTKKQLNALGKLYKREELPPITTLKIDGWGRGLTNKTFGTKQSKELIKHVESLTIMNTTVKDDLNECVLQYMPQLKRLILSKNLDELDLKDGWMDRKYPNLEYFAWHLYKWLPIQRIKTFLALNPNITHFSLKADSQSTLQQLQNEAVHVNELYFTFTTSMVFCLRELQNLCEGNLCRRLHLKFPQWYWNESISHHLIPLCPYIEGLYFENDHVGSTLAQTIKTCDRLKVIQLKIGQNSDWLSQCKSLEEVYAYWNSSSRSYKVNLFNFIAHTPNVKKFYMRLFRSQPFEKFDFSDLDAERLKLGGATKLTVYLKTDKTTFTGRPNDVECVHKSIEVTRIETEHTDNPLVTKYLASA